MAHAGLPSPGCSSWSARSSTGGIGELSRTLTDATGGRELGAALTLPVGSALLSGIIGNIPYVATMAPMTADLVKDIGAAGDSHHVLWWALALGADLGGNASAIGVSANVVVLGVAERNRQLISFWQFTQCGILVTLTTVLISALSPACRRSTTGAFPPTMAPRFTQRPKPWPRRRL
ncbi:SLC13 family permease [Streptomyces sp. NPDC001530]|uniref:SLC13 family permease n=1 Tax=Streptomyces sp. NPDC001530 TaxID=3364582 RepID=UPI0036B78F6D